MSVHQPPASDQVSRLAAARDPRVMQAVFQEHLVGATGAGDEIRACRVLFVRDRAAGRGTIQYSVRLRDPATGAERDQVVTGVSYGENRTQQTWEWLRSEGPTGPAPGALVPLPQFAYVPELDLLLQVFPFDHRLPALSRLLAGPVPEVVSAILPEFGPGDWSLIRWAAEPVRYRVDMRASVVVTIRVREAATDREEERRFYAKVYRDWAQGAAAERRLRDLGARAGDAFDVGAPVAWLPEPRILVQAEVAGGTLYEVFNTAAAVPAARLAAAALAALHRSGVDAPERRTLAEELAQLEQAGAALGRARPELAGRIGAVVEAVVAGLPEAVEGPTHGDLKPGHILIDGERVALLDFDRLSIGDPIRDVAEFLAILRRMAERGRLPEARARAVAAAFVEEYGAGVPAAWLARLPLRAAMALLGAAATSGRGLRDRNGRSGGRRSDWADGVARLVADAEVAATGGQL